jgi:hypothetical protein
MAKILELSEAEAADVAVVVRETNKLIAAANADAATSNPDAPQIPPLTVDDYLQGRCDQLFAGFAAQADEVENGSKIREALAGATPEQKAAIKEVLNIPQSEEPA